MTISATAWIIINLIFSFGSTDSAIEAVRGGSNSSWGYCITVTPEKTEQVTAVFSEAAARFNLRHDRGGPGNCVWGDMTATTTIPRLTRAENKMLEPGEAPMWILTMSPKPE